MGELLSKMEKNKGGEHTHKSTPPHKEGVVRQPTYNEIGIGYKEAAEAQTLAKLPDEEKKLKEEEL